MYFLNVYLYKPDSAIKIMYKIIYDLLLKFDPNVVNICRCIS